MKEKLKTLKARFVSTFSSPKKEQDIEENINEQLFSPDEIADADIVNLIAIEGRPIKKRWNELFYKDISGHFHFYPLYFEQTYVSLEGLRTFEEPSPSEDKKYDVTAAQFIYNIIIKNVEIKRDCYHLIAQVQAAQDQFSTLDDDLVDEINDVLIKGNRIPLLSQIQLDCYYPFSVQTEAEFDSFITGAKLINEDEVALIVPRNFKLEIVYQLLMPKFKNIPELLAFFQFADRTQSGEIKGVKEIQIKNFYLTFSNDYFLSEDYIEKYNVKNFQIKKIQSIKYQSSKEDVSDVDWIDITSEFMKALELSLNTNNQTHNFNPMNLKEGQLIQCNYGNKKFSFSDSFFMRPFRWGNLSPDCEHKNAIFFQVLDCDHAELKHSPNSEFNNRHFWIERLQRRELSFQVTDFIAREQLVDLHYVENGVFERESNGYDFFFENRTNHKIQFWGFIVQKDLDFETISRYLEENFNNVGIEIDFLLRQPDPEEYLRLTGFPNLTDTKWPSLRRSGNMKKATSIKMQDFKKSIRDKKTAEAEGQNLLPPKPHEDDSYITVFEAYFDKNLQGMATPGSGKKIRIKDIKMVLLNQAKPRQEID